jgi:hypothetical protein
MPDYNYGYKQEYLAIKNDYDTQCSMSESSMDRLIENLDPKVKQFTSAIADTRPAFCFNSDGTILGRQSGDIQIYREAECAVIPNSRWNQSGECLKSGGGSYSWDCRPSAGTGGANMDALRRDLSGTFQPIGDYYTKLLTVKNRLNTFLEKASDKVVESKDPILNEERYNNRANPEEAVKPRELVFGLFSELKPTSVPYLLAAGVFMASISLLMIFQMFGFTGQINIPPALSELPGKLSAAAASTSSGPLYQNPMILSGLVILLGAGVIGLGILYYKAKQTSK